MAGRRILAREIGKLMLIYNNGLAIQPLTYYAI
jgi:hypothetical protein